MISKVSCSVQQKAMQTFLKILNVAMHVSHPGTTLHVVRELNTHVEKLRATLSCPCQQICVQAELGGATQLAEQQAQAKRWQLQMQATQAALQAAKEDNLALRSALTEAQTKVSSTAEHHQKLCLHTMSTYHGLHMTLQGRQLVLICLCCLMLGTTCADQQSPELYNESGVP